MRGTLRRPGAEVRRGGRAGRDTPARVLSPPHGGASHTAELDRIQASAEARAAALEEARADLRARAERELDQARAALAGTTQETAPEPGTPPRQIKRRGTPRGGAVNP
jgi:hypothetical protein